MQEPVAAKGIAYRVAAAGVILGSIWIILTVVGIILGSLGMDVRFR